MKVFPASDIVGIASAFGIARHQYKEIKRDEEAYEIVDRWPMLAELHGLVPVPADINALTATGAGTEAASPVSGTSTESTGLKAVSPTNQNAEAGYQPTSAPIQIAA